jgi:hypothetical protein
MTPDAVVIANGQVLGDRDDYINGAAKGDAAALATVQRDLLRRDAKAGPNLAWVLSEKRLRAPAPPRPERSGGRNHAAAPRPPRAGRSATSTGRVEPRAVPRATREPTAG